MPDSRRTCVPALLLASLGMAASLASAASGAGATTRVDAHASLLRGATWAITQRPAASTATASGTTSPKPAAAGDAPAAPPVQAIDAAGLRKLLAAERGKLVVVNLWATWCVPCLREIPDLVTIGREFAPRGVTLLGLSMDEPSALEDLVEPFRRKNFPAFHSWLRSEPDMDSLVSVIDPAWNETLPTTYVIGRDGKLVKKIQGKRTLEQFREILQEVL